MRPSKGKIMIKKSVQRSFLFTIGPIAAIVLGGCSSATEVEQELESQTELSLSEPQTSICGCTVAANASGGSLAGSIRGTGEKRSYNSSTKSCSLKYSLTDPRYAAIMDPDAACKLAWSRASDGPISATTSFVGSPTVSAPYGRAIPVGTQSSPGCGIDVDIPDGDLSKKLRVSIENCACSYSYSYRYPVASNPFQSCSRIESSGSSGKMTSSP